MTTVTNLIQSFLLAVRRLRRLPTATLSCYIAALSGALAVILFLVLPIVQVSILGMDFTRTGSELIRNTFESDDGVQIAFSFAMTLALISAGLGSLLFLGSRHKSGSILGGVSLLVLVGLGVYLMVREESPKLIAIGLWLSVLLLAVQSTSTLLASAWSRPPRVRDNQSGDISKQL